MLYTMTPNPNDCPKWWHQTGLGLHSIRQGLAHQLVKTKEEPVVSGPGQLCPCDMRYSLASLNHRSHSAASSSSSKPSCCSWLALQLPPLLDAEHSTAQHSTAQHSTAQVLALMVRLIIMSNAIATSYAIQDSTVWCSTAQWLLHLRVTNTGTGHAAWTDIQPGELLLG